MKNYEPLIFRQFSDIYWYVTASVNQVWLSLKKNPAKMHKYIKYQYLLLKDLFWSCTHAIVIFACTKDAIQITWHSVHWSAIWEGNSLILPFKHSQSKTKQKNNHPNQTKKVTKTDKQLQIHTLSWLITHYKWKCPESYDDFFI